MAENFDLIVNNVREGRGMPEGLSAMEHLPSALRGAFRTPYGKQFVAADLSQIELRVLAWITRCVPMLDTFHNDLDLYIAFACSMYNAEYDAVTKPQRQIAKPAVLSCGYGTGGGREMEDKNGDIVKTGLWGYAESMGVMMEQHEAQNYVDIYRQTYREVPKFWYASEDALRGLLLNEDHRDTWFDRIHIIKHRSRTQGEYLLQVVLPSGRSLWYPKTRIAEANQWGKVQIEYEGEIPNMGKLRGHRRLYGSLFTENLVQAIARDVMAVGMVRATREGFSIVGHTHDEIVCEEGIGNGNNLEKLNELMCAPIEWCEDLPLKSEGWEGNIYRK